MKYNYKEIERQMDEVERAYLRLEESTHLLLDQIVGFIENYQKEVYPLLWKSYVEVGCPYGKDEKGLWKWIGQLNEENKNFK